MGLYRNENVCLKELKKKGVDTHTLKLRSGAWYGDYSIELETPSNWEVNVLYPQTPSPLNRDQIAEILQNPTGQEPIQLLCRGKSRPLIIVDDLTRPTPAEQVMPILLKYFEEANIQLKNVTILMATGSHGQPAQDAMRKKVGNKAAESCRLIIHDCFNTVKVGKTSFGTRIYVNAAVLKSDFVVGIGGVYPNRFAGFGGGTKLALGVLGVQSIFSLHSLHKSIAWGSLVDTTFRCELNEIADIIGLQTVISLQVNSDRKIIHVDSGDPKKYYPKARDFARQTFRTPFCGDADVIISNTYPIDLSLTFAQDKGFNHFSGCKSSASKIAIASCNEGVGLHNIFPFLDTSSRYKPRFHRERQLCRLYRENGPIKFSKSVLSNIKRSFTKVFASPPSEEGSNKHPIWLYQPGRHKIELPSNIPGIVCTSKWPEILQSIKKEQENLENLKVMIYPCAPIQPIEP